MLTQTSARREGLEARVRAALEALGAPPRLAAERGLALYPDASGLEVAHVSQSGRRHLLLPAAVGPWQALRSAAADEGIELVVISAFRSFERQLELLRAKLAGGADILELLKVMAPPGCSEHHSGRALDIGTPGCAPLSVAFEETSAYAWLEHHAADFGFGLSYPRGNRHGFLYEPWHWCWQPPPDAAAR